MTDMNKAAGQAAFTALALRNTAAQCAYLGRLVGSLEDPTYQALLAQGQRLIPELVSLAKMLARQAETGDFVGPVAISEGKRVSPEKLWRHAAFRAEVPARSARALQAQGELTGPVARYCALLTRTSAILSNAIELLPGPSPAASELPDMSASDGSTHRQTVH